MMKYVYMKRVPSNDVIVALKRRIRHVWIACVVGCSCFAISSIGASDAQARKTDVCDASRTMRCIIKESMTRRLHRISNRYR